MTTRTLMDQLRALAQHELDAEKTFHAGGGMAVPALVGVNAHTLLRLLGVVEAARRFDYTPEGVPTQDAQGRCVFCGCNGGKDGMYITKQEDHTEDCDWRVLHASFVDLDVEEGR